MRWFGSPKLAPIGKGKDQKFTIGAPVYRAQPIEKDMLNDPNVRYAKSQVREMIMNGPTNLAKLYEQWLTNEEPVLRAYARMQLTLGNNEKPDNNTLSAAYAAFVEELKPDLPLPGPQIAARPELRFDQPSQFQQGLRPIQHHQPALQEFPGVRRPQLARVSPPLRPQLQTNNDLSVVGHAPGYSSQSGGSAFTLTNMSLVAVIVLTGIFSG